MNANKGLTMPGKCESCGIKGPRFHFVNDWAEQAVVFDLCPACMLTAIQCMMVFFKTPAGREAIKRKDAR